MGETPLIRCAHNGHLACVQFLLEHGADVNAIDLVLPPTPPETPASLPSSSGGRL